MNASRLNPTRAGSRVALLTGLGVFAVGLPSNSAQAQDEPCVCDNSPCIPCNGLEQSPDYDDLVACGQPNITEDMLNGPWIETIKRIGQCVNSQFETLPIVDNDYFDSDDESNTMTIGGPTLIRVPDDDFDQSMCRLTDPTARKCYYVYYANHLGEWIRMSFAEHLSGPWTPYNPGSGVLAREDLLAENTGGSYPAGKRYRGISSS